MEKSFEVMTNRRLTDRTWEMRLSGDTSAFTAPGQFVEAAVEGCYLRRPLSVCDYSPGSLTLLYDVVGKGTSHMSRMVPGTRISLLTGLGNGFDVEASTDSPLLIGGGIGVAPLLNLAKTLIASGRNPKAVIGFGRGQDIVLQRELTEIGVETEVATIDGTRGVKGTVIDAIRERRIQFDYFYACGPGAMLRALCEQTSQSGELSLDERMGCGFGICMCCSIMTTDGPRRVCKDGPVFKKEKLIWK